MNVPVSLDKCTMRNREKRSRKSDVNTLKSNLERFINGEIGRKCRNWRQYVVLIEQSATSILIEFRGLASHLYNQLNRRLAMYARSNRGISFCPERNVMSTS